MNVHEAIPATTGVRFLRERGITFLPHFYPFQEHGGTAHAASSLAVDEHSIVKTIVVTTDTGEPYLVLMHGDREVSLKRLARTLGFREITVADQKDAERLTGYTVGGISPFGTRRALRVCVERTILALPRIFINGGKRGFLVEIPPTVLTEQLAALPVDVGIETA